jgi:hypothetical protein
MCLCIQNLNGPARRAAVTPMQNKAIWKFIASLNTHLFRQNRLHFPAQRSDCRPQTRRDKRPQKCGTSAVERSKWWPRPLVICMASRIRKDAIRTTRACTPNGHVNLNVLRTRTKSRSGRTRPTRALAKVHRRHRGLRVCGQGRRRERSGFTSRRRHWQTHSRSSLVLGTRRTVCGVLLFWCVRRDSTRKEHPPCLRVWEFFLPLCCRIYRYGEHRWTETSARRASVRTEAKATRSFLITIQNVALCL